jgi:hypothetical protein
MKKIFLFLAVVSAFSFASCKKDRVCTCTTNQTSNGITTTSTDVTTYNDSRQSDARELCQGQATTTTNGNGSTTATTCKLK